MLGLTRFGRGTPPMGAQGCSAIAAIVAVGVISIAVAYWRAKGYA